MATVPVKRSRKSKAKSIEEEPVQTELPPKRIRKQKTYDTESNDFDKSEDAFMEENQSLDEDDHEADYIGSDQVKKGKNAKIVADINVKEFADKTVKKQSKGIKKSSEVKDTKKLGKQYKVNTKTPDQTDNSIPERTILQYLEKQYRPYSVNDIVQNLHGLFSKNVTTKAIETLSNEGKIVTKLLGKMNISVANKIELTQEMNSIDHEEELTLLNGEIDDLEKTIFDLQQQYTDLIKYPDDATLDDSIRSAEEQINIYNERIKASSSKPSLNPESVKELQLLKAEVIRESENRVKLVS